MGMFLIKCFSSGHSEAAEDEAPNKAHVRSFLSNADVICSSHHTFRYLQTTVTYTICFVGHLSIIQTLELETTLGLRRSLPPTSQPIQARELNGWPSGSGRVESTDVEDATEVR